jgi:hypothetical protein
MSLLLWMAAAFAQPTDPLPSWNDGWTVISMKIDWKRMFAFEE